MKSKLFRSKIVCCLLCIILIVSCLPTSAIALDVVSSNTSISTTGSMNSDPVTIDPILNENEIESVNLDELKNRASDEKTISELKEMKVDVSSLPTFIDSNNALQKGHVNRLKSRETNLNTVVFQNNDGTETTYIFIQPVKYVDENGDVHDKSDKISSILDATYSYGVLNNNTKIYFPKNSNLGTKIQHQNYVIQMLPVTTYSSSPTYVDDTTVAYNGVFGENTILTYQTKLNGIKEDIVLVKNIEKNEFDFTLTLSNLTPIQIEGIWYLKNSNDNIVGSLGKIIVNDSAGNSVEGTMTIAPSVTHDTYSVKIIVPSEFLEANSTVYPVYIDPSTTIWEEGSYYYYDSDGYEYYEYYDAIQDVGLYSTAAAATLAESNQDYHKLGYYSSATGKIIYKLYDFYGQYGRYTSLSSDQIGNVFLYITVGSGTSTTLTAHPMTSTWDASVVGDDPVALYDSSLWSSYSSVGASSLSLDTTSGERAINITDIVKGWADYNNGISTAAYHNPENGFVLSSTLSSSYRNITAAEEFYADSVYIEMDTSSIGGDYYINNVLTGQFLKRYTSTSVTTAKYSTSNYLKWRFEYLGNDKYYIRSVYNLNYVLHGSGSTINLAYLPTNPSDEYIWDVQISDVGGVIIKNAYSGLVLKYDEEADEDEDSTTLPLSLVTAMDSSNANYEQTVWGIVNVNSYVNLTSVVVTNNEWIAIGSSSNSSITATPTNATWKNKSNFYWYSDNTSVATVDGSGRVTGVSNGSARITAKHKHTKVAYTFVITVGQLITNGTYYIQNANSHYFVDVEGPSTSAGAYIQQWRYHSGTQSHWVISYTSSGYYTIKSSYSGKYISVSGASSATGASIEQVASVGDASKWKITKTASGQYKLTAVCGESFGRSLSVPTSSYVGTNLIQGHYTIDENYSDEWNLYLLDTMFSNGTGITSNEEYYLMNLNTGYYLALETDSDESLTNVAVSTYTDADLQKWILELYDTSTGEFQIVSSNSTTGKVLDVTDGNIDIFTDYDWDCQQFIIQRVNWAPYEGTYVIKYGNGYVVADSSNNVCISTTFSDRAVWSIKLTTKYDADLYNFDYDGFDTTATQAVFEETFNTIGYSAYSFTNHTATQALNFMANYDAIFVFRGHGGAGCLEFHSEDASVNGYIYASSTATKTNCGYIGALSENALSDLRCALFIGCSTGRTNKSGDNLLDVTYNKGAHFVLGTLDTTYVNNSNAFLTGFLEAVELNYCIEDAIQYALQNAGSNITWPSYGYVGYYPVDYIGDIYQYLN